MFEYKEIIMERMILNDDLKFYQEHGWETVSYSICPNLKISILIRRELK